MVAALRLGFSLVIKKGRFWLVTFRQWPSNWSCRTNTSIKNIKMLAWSYLVQKSKRSEYMSFG